MEGETAPGFTRFGSSTQINIRLANNAINWCENKVGQVVSNLKRARAQLAANNVKAKANSAGKKTTRTESAAKKQKVTSKVKRYRGDA